MKITRIVLHRLRLPLSPPFAAAWDPAPRRHFDVTLTQVDTDAGLTGFGSGDTMNGFEAYAGLFTGTDPLAIARQAAVIETIGFHGGRYWPLEAALWDIAGQACGQPAAVLLGGAAASMPCYASFGEHKHPQARAETALAAREAGFRAVKVRISRGRVAAGLAAVRAVREAAGDSLEIMVDLNQWWRMAGDVSAPLDLPAVAAIAAQLRELGVLWLEEPLPGGDLAGMAALRAQSGVRVAGGEMARTPRELLDALAAGALDVVQPDAVLAVGMSRARTIAEVALLHGRWFTPHTWTDGLGLLANLHLAAGVGGGPYLEFPWDPPGWTPARRDFFLAEPVLPGPDGRLAVPAAPGLGALLDPGALAHHAIG